MTRACNPLIPWLVSALLGLIGNTCAAGVMADHTRLIFNEGQAQESLMLANTNAYPVVIQTWVDKGQGDNLPQNIVSAFIAMPAVFRLQPSALQSLQVILTDRNLPVDRESVFWLNLYEIPPRQDASAPDTTRVTLAMNTQLKIFYRPKNLPIAPEQLTNALHFRLEQTADSVLLVCRNDSPYHASFASVRLIQGDKIVAGISDTDLLSSPYSERRYHLDQNLLKSHDQLQVRYELIDDTGRAKPGQAPLR
ncbi:Pili assembly chaperone [Pseudomonas syringae pv. theae ICMP 3923]|uniref:Molecular chaperone n=3 Tax=Pseudomonas syringae group TaxID=136849 RepID=A0A261WEU4_9PSED|nr:molecular chaperone [Pseudomonas syringae]OZI84689.1 molecular chaperone [Pseudomonas avellanae]ATV17971.1 molecular chaperone [Pseudomonas syringae pv. actinidiae]EPM58739.1 Pili assembly chaperone [Pseudomonas syringae pv. actinidiae ICMP 19073]EPM70693.1 Pili assembly chaperone [Pseudomonas syringae pv. theae ICMP 3923]KPZ31015.1 hypothetical protein AN901_204973 [Pseudomonas syringae pv. theae]